MSNINNPGLSNPSVALTGVPTAPTAPIGTNTTQLATTAFVQSNAGGASSLLTRRRQAIISADGGTVTPQAVGDGAVIIVPGSGTGTNVITPVTTPTSGPGIGIFDNSANAVNAISGNLNYVVGRNISAFIVAGAAGKNPIADLRWWFGLTDQTAATQGGSDNPAGNYAAFRYSTNASDTHWQAITKDGTTQNIQSTGVAPIISTPQTFAIIFNDGIPNISFYINGTLVATSTSHLPTSGAVLRYALTENFFVSGVNGLIFEQIFIVSDL